MATKLVLTAHESSGAGASATPNWKAEAGKYTAMINPEKFNVSRKINFEASTSGDTAGAYSVFKNYAPDTLTLDLQLDGTGIVSDDTDIDDQITQIADVVYSYNGTDHRPPYVQLTYGKVIFKGQVETFNIEYSMFRSDGSTLRAKVSLSMKEYLDPKLEAKKNSKSSPDLTHVKTVRAGDSLPLMCREIYGDVSYYPFVAEANGLVNFRDLEVGSRLFFPPLQR